MEQNEDSTDKTAQPKKKVKIEELDRGLYSIAAGLIWQDRAILLPLYLLTIAPMLYASLSNLIDPMSWFYVKAAERLLQLAALYFIGWRALRSLSSTARGVNILSLCVMLIAGLLLWLAFFLPGNLVAAIGQSDASVLSLLLMLPIFIFTYLYYFYFFPLIMHINRPAAVLHLARSFTRIDKLLPVKVCVAPAGIMYLIQALCYVPFPDGRDFILALTSEIFGGVFWILSAYLSIACGIVFISDKVWHEAQLVPYRQSRLTTLAIQSISWLPNVLRPISGLQMLAISLLLWTANYARMAEMAPAPSISIKEISLKDERVELKLNLSDSKYRFRGFQPLLFRLAGEQNKTVAAPPQSARIEGSEQDVRIFFPREKDETSLSLVFQADRKAEDLRQLEDLYLWYGGAKISLLDMKHASLAQTTTETKEENK